MREVLEDVVRLIRPQASQQGVRLELHPPSDTLPRLALDSEKIEQAVLNLVLNALEAMPGGGELSLRTAVEDGQLLVVVRDTGPGIPPEIQDHIFHPYFSTKDRGTGIGLALAEKLVRQHRGHLDFRTGPGGTTFSITLPVTTQTRTGARPGHEHRSLSHPDRRRRAEHPDRAGPGARVRVVCDLDGQGRRRGPRASSATPTTGWSSPT